MKLTQPLVIAVITAIIASAPAVAKAASKGPVATACKSEIEQLCAGKSHNGEIRACLESNKDKVSPECKNALESTGGGKGKGKRRQQGY
jgi:hypothetical protein